MEVKLYKCSATNEPNSRKYMIESGAVFPSIYMDSEKLAEAVKKASSLKFSVLPLCNTLAAEALGADVNLGDNSIEPFIETYKYSSIDNFHFDNEKLQSERISIILEVIKNLTDSGYTVSFNLDGPITILASLIDSMKLFKSFRKEPALLKKAIDHLTDLIVDLGYRALDSGASVISYSDSSGTIDLIGPKYYGEFCVPANTRILSSLSDYILKNKLDSIIHLCGKTSSSLYSTDSIEIIPHDTDSNTYLEAINSVIYIRNNRDSEPIYAIKNDRDNGIESVNEDISHDRNHDFAIIGNSCLNRLNSPPFNNKIYEIRLK